MARIDKSAEEPSRKPLRAAMNDLTKEVRVIHFYDHDQDFLRWSINKKGRVLRSEPFQTDIWSRYIVENHKDVQAGEYVVIRKFGGHKRTQIKYQVLMIEEVSNG